MPEELTAGSDQHTGALKAQFEGLWSLGSDVTQMTKHLVAPEAASSKADTNFETLAQHVRLLVAFLGLDLLFHSLYLYLFLLIMQDALASTV